MKVTVFVDPKPSVLDPQGAAVEHAMHSLGAQDASGVRVGKTITFQTAEADSPAFRQRLDKLCADLLSNPVIEDYRYELAE
ncbi:MAG: phosphoribosylformylglycinamidine synthase subunit PurS [Verrucomicrobiota bacterium]